MKFISAIGWILFGFLLTPASFFAALGFIYVSPDMVLHFYKYLVCWWLFYYTLEIQS